MTDLATIIIYTDGACTGNPGPGGYAAVMLFDDHRTELSGGFRLTTNNRMELMGAIAALNTLQSKSRVTLHTDSQYLAESVTSGSARRWQAHRWMKTRKHKASNSDLWQRLLDLCDKHEVQFLWVEGHAGNTENERCDRLSVEAAGRKDLPSDTVYEEIQARAAGESGLFG